MVMMKNIKREVVALIDCARKRLLGAGKLRNRTKDHFIDNAPDAVAFPQKTVREKPETYVPTGAQWRNDSMSPHDTVKLRDNPMSKYNHAQPSTKVDLEADAAEGLTWIFDGECQDDYTTSMPKMVHAHDGEKACVGILLSHDLSQQLQSAILEHRKIKEAEENVDVELDELEQELNNLRDEIHSLECLIMGVQHDGSASEQENLGKMRQEVAALQQRQAEVQQLQDDVHRRMDEMYAALRHDQYELFDSLDELFVKSALLNPAPEGEVESGVSEAAIEHAAAAADDGHVQEAAIEVSVHSSAVAISGPPEADCGLHRMPAISDLKRTISIKEALNGQPVMVEEDAKRELLYNFRMKRTLLSRAEDDLDTRHERFDQEAGERDHKLAEGEQVETNTELDMRQLHDTQGLTRQVVDAEEAFQRAKAAAIAGGVQLPGSDIHSGFIDDVEDGYRISLGEELCASVDGARVLKWLQQLPELGQDEPQEAAEAEEEETPPEFAVETDDWDARTVEISDSSSMVAEGSTKKKIDTWRATCAALAHET